MAANAAQGALDAAAPLPDFELVGEYYQGLSNQLRLCQNIPAIAGQNALVEVIRQLGERVTQMEERMTARMMAK